MFSKDRVQYTQKQTTWSFEQKGRYRRPLFQNGHAMRPRNVMKPGYLQMDVKYVTPELSGLSFTCYEYGIIDIFSRYKVALILPILDESGSILSLEMGNRNNALCHCVCTNRQWVGVSKSFPQNV